MNDKVEQEYAAWIGIDWAEEQHEVCIQTADSTDCERLSVNQTPEALDEWIHELRLRFPDQKIAIALEQFRGGLVYKLMECDFLVLFLINPGALKDYRKALRCSGAKSDQSDAELLMLFLINHKSKLRAWHPDDALTRQLRMSCEFRRKLVNDGSDLSRQIQQLLKSYFPQALDWFSDLKTVMACDFLETWPTLEKVQKATPNRLGKFYRKHNCRNNEVIERRVQETRSAVALIQNQAIVSTSVMMVQSLVRQLREILKSVEEFEEEIERLYKLHPEHWLYDCLPGAGPALKPRLAVAMGLDRDRYQNAIQLQQFSGVAPVTEESGKSKWVHWRWACPKFLRQTFHEFAACSIAECDWAKACYDRQRALNKGHHAAVRVVAFKWQRILFRCWKDGAPYDDARYMDHLRKKRSHHIPVQIPKKASKPGMESAGTILKRMTKKNSTAKSTTLRTSRGFSQN